MDNERVFIVGLPRTGSTLLRTLLNRSDRVCITAETHFLHQWGRISRKKRITRFGDLKEEHNVDKFLDDLFSEHRVSARDFWGWLNNNVGREAFRQRLLATDRSDRAIFDLFMHLYAEKRKGGVPAQLILGEKTSANIYYVPTLMEWFPRTKIIHTFRDPRGIFVSAAKLVKAGKWGVKSKLPSLPTSLTDPVLEAVMAQYVLKNWLAAARLHALYVQQYPDRYLLVRFEDLLEDSESVIRQVCSFVEVPYLPEMLADVAVIGSSFNAQRIVPEGIDQSVAERWKEHIRPWTRTLFSKLGKQQLQAFGYLP